MTEKLLPGELEQIAHNLCSLHDFDPEFVKGQKKFALAVIHEWERVAHREQITLPAALDVRTPAPEGEVVSWRWRIVGPDTERLPWSYGADHPGSPAVLLNDGYKWTVQPLYASPVVPVGVSEEQRAKIEMVLFDYRHRIATLDAAIDAILAALGMKGGRP